MSTHTIDAGIGTFTANCEENLKLKMFLDSLKDRIEMDGKINDIIEFLDNGCKDNKRLQDEVDRLTLEWNKSEERISELLGEIEKLEEGDLVEDEINGGVGTIGYKTDNLLTQQVMEELEVAINKTDPLKVLRHLQNI